MKSLVEMADEVELCNRQHGWYDEERTWAELIALLHSEISEMLEGYRDYKFADVTDAGTGKPEGVGSELADIFIRILDMAKRKGLVGQLAISSGTPSFPLPWLGTSLGGSAAILHKATTELFDNGFESEGIVVFHFNRILDLVFALAIIYNIDMSFEYERKMAYNRTRPYKHGGRTI